MPVDEDIDAVTTSVEVEEKPFDFDKFMHSMQGTKQFKQLEQQNTKFQAEIDALRRAGGAANEKKATALESAREDFLAEAAAAMKNIEEKGANVTYTTLQTSAFAFEQKIKQITGDTSLNQPGHKVARGFGAVFSTQEMRETLKTMGTKQAQEALAEVRKSVDDKSELLQAKENIERLSEQRLDKAEQAMNKARATWFPTGGSGLGGMLFALVASPITIPFALAWNNLSKDAINKTKKYEVAKLRLETARQRVEDAQNVLEKEMRKEFDLMKDIDAQTIESFSWTKAFKGCFTDPGASIEQVATKVNSVFKTIGNRFFKAGQTFLDVMGRERKGAESRFFEGLKRSGINATANLSDHEKGVLQELTQKWDQMSPQAKAAILQVLMDQALVIDPQEGQEGVYTHNPRLMNLEKAIAEAAQRNPQFAAEMGELNELASQTNRENAFGFKYPNTVGKAFMGSVVAVDSEAIAKCEGIENDAIRAEAQAAVDYKQEMARKEVDGEGVGLGITEQAIGEQDLSHEAQEDRMALKGMEPVKKWPEVKVDGPAAETVEPHEGTSRVNVMENVIKSINLGEDFKGEVQPEQRVKVEAKADGYGMPIEGEREVQSFKSGEELLAHILKNSDVAETVESAAKHTGVVENADKAGAKVADEAGVKQVVHGESMQI